MHLKRMELLYLVMLSKSFVLTTVFIIVIYPLWLYQKMHLVELVCFISQIKYCINAKHILELGLWYWLWLRTPMVSSKVIALILSDARMASLSASVGSSLLGTFAESMTHISHRLTFTALRSARLSGEPWKIRTLLFIT